MLGKELIEYIGQAVCKTTLSKVVSLVELEVLECVVLLEASQLLKVLIR